MNIVSLVGRLVRDPDCRYTADQKAVCRFTLAVDRPTKPGEEKQADFLRIVCFGKTAENCDRYLRKGQQTGVVGKIHTGSYEKPDGTKVYTTDVVADRVEFLGSKSDISKEGQAPKAAEPDDFAALNEDVPF